MIRELEIEYQSFLLLIMLGMNCNETVDTVDTVNMDIQASHLLILDSMTNKCECVNS